jgi:hypothetical protein
MPADLIVRYQIEAACRGGAQAVLEKFAHNGLAGHGQLRRSFGAAPGGLCAPQARRPQ